ncbi:MAG: hypothetical protein JSR98_15230 [Proteobacteria bacterium]|nr:hypothetical protein [Pseudomonadota bacterium]
MAAAATILADATDAARLAQAQKALNACAGTFAQALGTRVVLQMGFRQHHLRAVADAAPDRAAAAVLQARAGYTVDELTLFRRLAGLGEDGAFIPLGEPACKAAQALVDKGWARRDDEAHDALRLTTTGWTEAERLGL